MGIFVFYLNLGISRYLVMRQVFFLFRFEHNASLQCLNECKQGHSCSKHILDVCHSDGCPTLTGVGHTLKQVDLSAALAIFSPQLFSQPQHSDIITDVC